VPEPLEDFAISVLEVEPSQTGNRQLIEADEPSSSSSKAHSAFRSISSYIHLTLFHAAWEWGKPAPSSTMGEKKAKRARKSVCWHISH
jgi:hypothetical protein